MDVTTLVKQESSLLPRTIQSRYLHVNFCLPFYVDADGNRYLDRLWVKDLVEHFKYLKNFTLASPCRYEDPPEGAVLLNHDPAFAQIQFIDLPSPNNTIEALRLLPKTISQLWKAVQAADVVHTGIAGWPIPEGWLLTPIVQLRKKFYLVIVESAPWRLAPGSPQSLKSRIRAAIVERMNRWCVNNANLAIFTQGQYHSSLMTRNSERGHVINASWIDEQVIVSDAEATKSWNQKLSSFKGELQVLFAGRLISEKGILVLLEAMKSLSKQGVPIRLDILGQGPLLEECEKISQTIHSPVRIRVLEPIPYGSKFFNLVKQYHVVVVPNLSDEQPRIVYDAYSQGIPVIASNTNGLKACVQDGVTGKLIPSNHAGALTNVLKWASQNLEQLAQMGFKSLKTARSLTHQEMHNRRWKILSTALDEFQMKDQPNFR